MSERKRVEIWPLSYESILKDLYNTPDNLKNCIDYYFKLSNDLIEKIQKIINQINIKRILFIGNTFNYFASYIPIYLMMHHSSKLNYWWQNYELTDFYDYNLPQFQDQNTIYIFISKSGESKLIKRSIERLRMLNIDKNQIWLVTNNLEPSVKNYCGLLFPINTSDELILGTKSFINTIFVIWLIGMILINENPFNNEIYNKLINIIEEMRKFESQSIEIANQIIEFFGIDFKFIYFLSKGASLSIAYQASLAAKTFGHVYANCLSFGLFYHGSFQIADENFRSIFYIGDDFNGNNIEIIPRLIDITTKKLAKGRILLIGNNEEIIDKVKNNPNVYIIKFKCNIPFLSPIIEYHVSTLIILEFAVRRGLIMFK